MNTIQNLIQTLPARYKALVALLGGLLGVLYQVEVVAPNKYVSLAIALLTALGVHQIVNKQ